MIAIEDLKRIAKLKGLRNMGNAEKDYLLDIALLSVSRNTKDEMVLKGGTCLYKFYKLDRFSEDIDFTLRKELNVDNLIKKIISDLTAFGIEAEIKNKKRVLDSVMITIRTKGPMYQGTSQSLSNIRVDINIKSTIDLEPDAIAYSSLYPDIPSFSLLIMQEKEILAEKIRAILTRSKARDVYDLWFLLKKGVEFDLRIVKEKLNYYSQIWNFKEFSSKIKIKKDAWEAELGPTVTNVPDLKEVRNYILKEISKHEPQS